MSERDISDQFTEAEQALDERINAYVFAPKFTPAGGSDLEHSYKLIQEDLKFQSSLGDDLKQQQSIIYAHGAKRKLAEKAAQDERDAQSTNSANTEMMRLMGKGMPQSEAFRMVTTAKPELILNDQFKDSYPFFKGEFEDDDERLSRERKETLAGFKHDPDLMTAKELEVLNKYKLKHWPEYVSHLEIEAGEKWEQTRLGQNMRKWARDKNAMNHLTDGSVPGMFRNRHGGEAGSSVRPRTTPEGQDREFGDLDSVMDPEESLMLMGWIDEQTGITIDSSDWLMNHVFHDAEAGFIQSRSEWGEFGLTSEEVGKAIMDLSDTELNEAALEGLRNGNRDTDAANRLRAARRIIRIGGRKYMLNHKDVLEQAKIKKAQDKEIADFRTKVETIAKGIGTKIDAIDGALSKTKWDQKWGQWQTKIEGTSTEIAAGLAVETEELIPVTEDNYPVINRSLDAAWTAGAEVLSEIMRQYGSEHVPKGEIKAPWTERELIQIYDERLRMNAQHVLGTAPGMAGHEIMSPAGYSRAIRSFISEVLVELSKPPQHQRFLVPFEHRVSPDRIEEFKARGGKTSNGVPLESAPRKYRIKIPRGEHDPEWGYIFQEEQKKESPNQKAKIGPLGKAMSSFENAKRGVHVVRSGDSPSKIASAYNISVAKLQELNPELRGAGIGELGKLLGQEVRIREGVALTEEGASASPEDEVGGFLSGMRDEWIAEYKKNNPGVSDIKAKKAYEMRKIGRP